MINKKKLLVIAAVLIILFGLGGFLVLNKKTSSTIPFQVQPLMETQKQPEEKLLTYKDEAGFQFEYADSLTVKDVAGDDETVYSSLELTSAKQDGKMIIKIADTSFASLDTWLKSKEASGAGSSREIVLAEMPGSQIQFDNPKRLVTVAISEGIIYFIQSPLDGSADSANYWNKIHNNLVSSFALTQAESSGLSGESGSAGDVIYEEEEVIE